jgi:lipoyl(octanoyl) transferase
MVDLLERVEALLELESNSYQTIDYLSPVHQQRILNGLYTSTNQVGSITLSSSNDLQSAFTTTCSSTSSSHSGINEVWRERICEWSYQVIDHFDFSREVVSISTHYLDRVLAKTHVNKKLFQLVAMTALYVAIKIYEPGTLNMSSMIELSRGYFSPAQMAEMEMAILRYVTYYKKQTNKPPSFEEKGFQIHSFIVVRPIKAAIKAVSDLPLRTARSE